MAIGQYTVCLSAKLVCQSTSMGVSSSASVAIKLGNEEVVIGSVFSAPVLSAETLTAMPTWDVVTATLERISLRMAIKIRSDWIDIKYFYVT